jgi:hypothetical protein
MGKTFMKDKMKILIAYDGSDCADAALEDLKNAGLPKTAEAIVMSLADVFLPPRSMKSSITSFQCMCRRV